MEHKLHCHVYEARLLSDICPVQSFPCYGFKVHINIFLLRKSRNFSGLFFHVSHQNPLHVSLFDLRIPRPIHVMCIDLFARIFTSRVTDINKMSHSKNSFSLLLLPTIKPKYLPKRPIFIHLELIFPHNVRGQVSVSQKWKSFILQKSFSVFAFIYNFLKTYHLKCCWEIAVYWFSQTRFSHLQYPYLCAFSINQKKSKFFFVLVF